MSMQIIMSTANQVTTLDLAKEAKKTDIDGGSIFVSANLPGFDKPQNVLVNLGHADWYAFVDSEDRKKTDYNVSVV